MFSWKASDKPHIEQQARWRRIVIRLVLACLAGVIFVAAARPVLAGFVLKYYTATTVNDQLLLEWETISEFNISGFELFCKEELQPDDQYHPIGTRPAVGSLESGAAYGFLVESGLEPGVTYCFRLQEITTDGSPPEQSEICGYGINIDPNIPPTPAETAPPVAGLIAATPTVVQVLLPTPIAGEGTPITIAPLYTNFNPGPISISGPTPLPTLTTAVIVPQPDSSSSPTPAVIAPQSDNSLSPAEPESPLPTPERDATDFRPQPTPTPTAANDSPLTTPTVIAAAGNQAANSGTNDANVSPVESPTQIPTFTPAVTPTSTPAWTPSPSVTPMAAAGQAVALADTEITVNDQGVNTQGINAPAQSTPSYIVVTATATPLNQTPVATFTPYPTAVPANQDGLFALANPTVENLILLILCFIFLGVGGMGVLGLTATMLYIRSRREPESPYRIDQFDIGGYDINGRTGQNIDQNDDWLR